MSKLVYANFDRCSYCMGCEVACQRESHGITHIHVVLINDRFAVPMMCRQCNPASCVIACPTQALTIADDRVKLDLTKCTGCTLCLFACPFGVMSFNPETKTAAKCDLCANRINDGREPVCVLTCPSSALFYCDYDHFVAKERRLASFNVMRSQPLIRGVQ